jgi:hypothetical protein
MRRSATALCLALGILAFAAAPSVGISGVRSLRLGGVPLQLVSARGVLWVLTCERRCSGEAKRSVGRVVEVDARTGRVIASATLARPGAIAVGRAGVYATDFWRDAVRRLDPRTLRVTATLHLTLPYLHRHLDQPRQRVPARTGCRRQGRGLGRE